MRFVLALFIFCSSLALAQEFKPSFTISSSYLVGQDALSPTIGSDLVAAVNPNLGAATSSFSLSLSPNFSKLKKLNFNYSSLQTENLGFGVGLSIDLPRVVANNNTNPRLPFIYNGLGAGELVATDEDLSVQLPLIEKILRKAGIDGTYSAGAYRPWVDETFNLFVKIEVKDILYWVVLELDGSRWLLNSHGECLFLFDRQLNALTFSWQDGVLKGIRAENQWSMVFNYSESLSPYPLWRGERWVRLPRSLNSIQYFAHSVPGLVQKEVQFDYDAQGEFLQRVFYKGGIADLFKARYAYPSLPSNDHEQIVEAIPAEGIDLNNDGIIDSLQAQSPSLIDFLKSYKFVFQKMANEVDFDEVYQASDASIATFKGQVQKWANQPFSVNLSTASGFTNDSQFTKILNQLSGPIKIKFVTKSEEFSYQTAPNHAAEIQGESRKALYRYVDLEVGDSSNKLFFVDMNGDGRKDVVACPVTAGVASTVTIDGRSYDLKHAYILSQTHPKLSTESKMENPFALSAGEGKVYIQKMKPVESRQGNPYQLEPMAGTIKCNQFTQFIDLNGDGITDVVANNALSLRNPQGGAIELPFDFNAVFEKNESIDLKQNLELIDLDGDGKLELVNADAIRFDREARHRTIYRKEYEKLTASAVIPLPARKLLVEVSSSFGATKKLNYAFLSGNWVVESSEQALDEGNGETEITRYHYLTPAFDSSLDIFVGFRKVREEKTYSSINREPSFVDYQYTADLEPSFIHLQTRGRLNGKLSQRIIRSFDPSLLGNQLRKDGIFYQYTHAAKELSSDRLFYYAAKKKIITRKDNLSSSVQYDYAFDQWLHSDQGAVLFTTAKTRESAGDQATGQIINISDYQFNEHQYLRQELSTYRVDHRGKKQLQHPVKNEYDIQGRLVRSCRGMRCELFEYEMEAQGRLRSVVKEYLGEVDEASRINYSYRGETPLISSAQDEARTFQYIYSSLGDVKEKVVESVRAPGAEVVEHSFNYSPDGVLLAHLEGSTYRYQLAMTSQNEAQVQHDGVRYDLFFDGLGRVRKTIREDQVVLNDRVFYGDGLLNQSYSPSFIDAPHDREFTLFSYDHLGQLIKKDERGSSYQNTTEIERGVNEEKVEVNSNAIQHLKFDPLSYKTNEETFEFEMHTFSYDLVGNLEEEKNNRNKWNYNKYGEVIGLDDSIYFRSIDESGKNIVEGTAASKLRYNGELESYQDDLLAEELDYQFGKVKTQTYTLKNEGDSFAKNYAYDHKGLLSQFSMLNLKRNYHYDLYNRVSSVEIAAGKSAAKLQFEYRNGLISSLPGMIDRIERDASSRIIRVHYQSGVELLRVYHPQFKTLESVSLVREGKEIYCEEYSYNTRGKMVSRTIRSSLEKANSSDSFDYLDKGVRLSSQVEEGLIQQLNGSDKIGQLLVGKTIDSSKPVSLQWNNGNLVGLTSGIYDPGVESQPMNRFVYDAKGSLVTSLSQNESFDSEKSFVLVDDYSFLYYGKYFELIVVDGITLGVLADGAFYPLVADHLGSVKALYDLQKNDLMWVRTFDAWGEKEVFFSDINNKLAKVLERMTIWNYAQLLIPPSYLPSIEKNRPLLYWSKSRVFSPQIKRWLSADPLVLWGANSLLGTKGNWDYTRYCNNDPLNCVDPTGKWGIRIGVGLGVDVIIGRSYSLGFAIARDDKGKFSFGVYKSKHTSVGLKVGFGVDLFSIGISNAKHVTDFDGLSGGFSISGELRVGPGGSLGFEKGVLSDGRIVSEGTLSFGLGYSIGVEAQASETILGEIKSDVQVAEEDRQYLFGN